MTAIKRQPEEDERDLSNDVTVVIAEAVTGCLDRVAHRQTPWLVSVHQLREELQDLRRFN
jgi:hypothetical protein